MTLNDFKSVVGDREMGVRSLPVQLGERRAAVTACGFMLSSQALVALYLIHLGAPSYAAWVGVLMAAQVPLMIKFVQQPTQQALRLSAFGVPLFVAGMMVSAWALRHLNEVV